ncbi:GtrA family protein [Wenjunlia vitaminophila]|uniref:GtrA family protein n=1 Tax=Wenjunlia vitaminophila TaxID=76728 RepID=UPI00036EF26E|nr:GtrA family protein [Wenjunlia vitaminophila]
MRIQIGFRDFRQFVTFALVGVVNTGTYYATYLTCNLVLPYLLAHGMAYAVSMTGSFLLNSWITCRTRPTWRKFLLYPLSGVVNLVGATVALFVCVSWLGLSEALAPFVSGFAVVPLTFLVARRILTSDTGKAPEPRRAGQPAGDTVGPDAPSAASTPERGAVPGSGPVPDLGTAADIGGSPNVGSPTDLGGPAEPPTAGRPPSTPGSGGSGGPAGPGPVNPARPTDPPDVG